MSRAESPASTADRVVRSIDVAATDVGAVSNAIEDMYDDVLDVIVIRNAFDRERLSAAGEALDRKRDRLAPFVMGLCRGLVYCVAAAAVSSVVPRPVLVAAAGLAGYVVGLTWIAKRLGPSAGYTVPILLAGISLVDAVVILVSGGGTPLALVAAAGFPLTLLLQRIVPGT